MSNSFFREIYSLISAHQTDAAIELLSEYLENHPNSVTAHKTLGHCLKSCQPRRAAFHLEKALELMRNGVANVDSTASYDPNAFDDDDLVYIETESENLAEEE